MPRKTLSNDSLAEASRWHSSFSGHGNGKGAGGHRAEGGAPGAFLSQVGDTEIINPKEGGFENIRIGMAWDEMLADDRRFIGRLFKRKIRRPIDLDLGCLYELQTGERGVIQAFGDHYGAPDKPPYVHHSGDERTGRTEGEDEYIEIKGHYWPGIKRLILYTYIYGGVPHWGSVQPRILIDIPGEKDMTATLAVTKSELAVCAIAGIENVRDGMKLTNYTEYFPGHAEMDRAFGFGVQWEDGKKTGES